jgi:hypothetical protein
MEAAMTRGKGMLTALPLLIGIAIALSACAAAPVNGSATYAYNYGYPVYDYPYPAYGSLEFGYWGGWGGDRDWHRRWDHGGRHGHR